jgi:hypothetical protein
MKSLNNEFYIQFADPLIVIRQPCDRLKLKNPCHRAGFFAFVGL